MGFYGHITNTQTAQLNFDKIYPNRYAMETAQNKVGGDGVYLGRFILVEYDNGTKLTEWLNGTDDFIPRAYLSGKTYQDYVLLYRASSTGAQISDYVNALPGDYYKVFNNITGNFEIYQVVRNLNADEMAGVPRGVSLFENILVNFNNTYFTNYTIDANAYGKETGIGRGYDSTVWQKVFQNGKEIYINIADLNSAVPTFSLASEAPTENPKAPHFGKRDSTNLHYTLHVQPPWGFRVKRDATGTLSDVRGEVYSFNPSTNLESIQQDQPLAIYFNQAGFNPNVAKYVGTKKSFGSNGNSFSDEYYDTNDYIKIENAKSGRRYVNELNGLAEDNTANDIKEISIYLPSIGNAVAKMWDIIHGPARDNSKVNSMAGILQSFSDINANEIPIKLSGGNYLIGTKINGGVAYSGTFTKDVQVYAAGTNSDDPWIRTEVSTNSNGGIHQNAIRIHHTAHFITAINTPVNYNTLSSDVNTLVLNDPIRDQAGHIIAINTRTITLPYSLKSLQINSQSTATNQMTANTNTITATTSQDKFFFTSGNKWIRLGANSSNKTVSIAHSVETINTSTPSGTLSNEASTAVSFETYNFSYDNAGHITSKTTKTWTMPYSYGKITDDNNTTISSSATFDTLSIKGDNWIKTTATTDTITLTHIGPVSTNHIAISNETPKFGSTFTIQDWTFDGKGHKANSGTHTVKIPQGSLTESKTDGKDGVVIDLSFVPEDGALTYVTNDLGSLKIGTYTAPYNQTTNNNTTVSAISNVATSTLATVINSLDNRIMTEEKNRINAIDALDVTALTDINGKVLVNISQTNGKINATNLELGNVLLGSYTAPTAKRTTNSSVDNISASAIAANTTLSNIIKILDERIMSEEKNRIDAIDALDYSSESTTQFISKISQTDGKISITRSDGGTLSIGAYSSLAVSGDIQGIASNDSINSVVQKLEHRIKKEEVNRADAIDNLDLAANASTSKFISSISQTNGKISVTRDGYGGTLELGTGYKLAESASNIAATDTIQTALGKLEYKLNILNGESSTAGSVAYQIAQIVSGADTKYDTLKEIADWILSDTTGAAKMQSDISTLQENSSTQAANITDLQTVVGVEKTEESEATGLYKIIDDLMARVAELESMITYNKDSNTIEINVEEGEQSEEEDQYSDFG